MGFDPCYCFLKIWESTRTPNSQSGSSFGSVKVHSFTLSCTLGSMKCDSWASLLATPLQALALVMNPRLGLRHIHYMYPYTYAILGPCSNWVTTWHYLWMPHLALMKWNTNCSYWCMIWPSSHMVANHLGHHESTNMWKLSGVVRCSVDKSPITNATLETILFHYGWCPIRILNIVVGYTLSFFIFGNSVN